MSPYERARLLHTSNAFFEAIAKEHQAEAEAMYQAFKARMILELVVLESPCCTPHRMVSPGIGWANSVMT